MFCLTADYYNLLHCTTLCHWKDDSSPQTPLFLPLGTWFFLPFSCPEGWQWKNEKDRHPLFCSPSSKWEIRAEGRLEPTCKIVKRHPWPFAVGMDLWELFLQRHHREVFGPTQTSDWQKIGSVLTRVTSETVCRLIIMVFFFNIFHPLIKFHQKNVKISYWNQLLS